MSELSRLRSQELLPSDARRTGRAISRMQAREQVRLSRIEADVEAAMMAADGVTAAAGQASADIVRLARAQKELELLAPEASARLNLIGEQHALTMADILSDLGRTVRRR